MLDDTPQPLSPLAGLPEAPGAPCVVLGDRSLRGLWQIAGWDGFVAAAAPVLRHLGAEGPGDYRRAQNTDRATLWRIAPDRVMIETAELLDGFSTSELALLDLGHARAVITLSGPLARDLLAQVIAIDTSPETLRHGDFLQTGLGHVAVLVHCTGKDSFDILVPGTWAASVRDLLCHNAATLGARPQDQQQQPA